MEKWMPFLQRTPPTRSGTSEVPELIFRGWTRTARLHNGTGAGRDQQKESSALSAGHSCHVKHVLNCSSEQESAVHS